MSTRDERQQSPKLKCEEHMQLSLGPVLYYWPSQKLYEFYEQVCDLPVARVYLGETVCWKRRALKMKEWLALARSLAQAGKKPILSTLALIESGGELSALRSLCYNGEFLVEANNMGAVNLLFSKKLPFVAGPGVNIYNFNTLKILHEQGLIGWVPPTELPRQALEDIIKAIHREALPIETEFFAYGKIPLAYSARCFTARAYHLPKDQCEFRCLEHPEGIEVYTQEKKKFLTINGIQVQSAEAFSALSDIPELQRIGIDILRMSPQDEDISQMVNHFHALTLP